MGGFGAAAIATLAVAAYAGNQSLGVIGDEEPTPTRTVAKPTRAPLPTPDRPGLPEGEVLTILFRFMVERRMDSDCNTDTLVYAGNGIWYCAQLAYNERTKNVFLNIR